MNPEEADARRGFRWMLGRAALVAAAWYGGARLGLSLSFRPDHIAAFWPPNAVLLAALLLTRRREWWCYLLAVVPAELAADLPQDIRVGAALGFVASDWIEVLAAALLLRWWMPDRLTFAAFRQIGIYLGAAVLAGPLIAAFPAALVTGLDADGPRYWIRWQQWVAADTVTHLTLTPFLILAARADFWRLLSLRGMGLRLIEPAFYLAALLFVCFLAFGPAHVPGAHSPALLFLPLPVLLWAAVRFQPAATFSSATLLALTAISYAHAGRGPFTGETIPDSVFHLQAFLLLSLSPLMVLAVLMAERRRVESRLRESEETHRHLVEHQADMVVQVNAKGRFLFVSPSFCETFGKGPDELLGQSFLPVVHEDDRETAEGAMEALGRPPHTLHVELRAMTKEGRRWLAWSNRAILDDDGSIAAVVGVGRDIHDRKLAQEALRESEDRYRSLVEHAPVPVFVHRAGRLLFVNTEAARMLGNDRTELTGRQLTEYLHPDDRERVLGQLTRIAEGQDEKLVGEFRICRTDGTVVDVEATAMTVAYDAEPARLVIGVDRTSKMKAQREKAELMDQLERSRRMEAMGLLAGGVAHDLNNILSGIMSYPELLLMDLDDDSRLRKPLLTIQESGRRAAAVVQDMLTIARGIASPREVASLNRIVESCLASAEVAELRRRRPDVTLEHDLTPDLLNVRCSEVHIVKALYNLVLNAFEAMGGSGQVRIGTGNRYLDPEAPGREGGAAGEYVVLLVEDDGPGIAEDDLGRIFEPFFTKRKLGRGGTGLGLAVVWNTVQDHGGTIEVRSGDDGTTFELRFPATREAAAGEHEEAPVEEILGKGESVLVVDDEPLQRSLAQGILERLGYEVETAEDGETAAARARERAFDLVLLDMIMPGLDGRRTYELLIETKPGQKAVIASGFSPTEDVRRAQELGAGTYLKKPYTVERLGRALRAELDGPT